MQAECGIGKPALRCRSGPFVHGGCLGVELDLTARVEAYMAAERGKLYAREIATAWTELARPAPAGKSVPS